VREPNTLFPDVPVELDRLRHFRVDFRALIEIQDVLGGHLPADGEVARLPIAKVRDVFAAALRHEDSSITPEQVGRYVTTANLKEVLAAFTEAWRLAMGEGESQPRPLVRALLQ